MSALGKKIQFIIIALLLTSLVYALDFSIPLQGNIEVYVNATFPMTQETNSLMNIHTIVNNQEILGRGVISLNLTKETNESFILFEKFAKGSFILKNTENITLQDFSLFHPHIISNCFSINATLVCSMIFEVRDKNSKVGDLSYTLHLDNLENQTMFLSYENKSLGILKIDTPQITLNVTMEEPSYKSYYGEVKYENSKPFTFGEIKAEVDDEVYKSSIISGKIKQFRVYGRNDTEVTFFINGLKVARDTLNSKDEIKFLEIVYPLQSYKGGFTDSDRDGIPNKEDQCDNSTSKTVDRVGCNCEQKICLGNCEETITAECIEVTQSQNQKIENITPKPISCQESGCSEGFTCQDNDCVMKVELKGKMCKESNSEWGENLQCKDLEGNWVLEDKEKYGSINVKGLPILSSIIKNYAKKKLKKINLCVELEDLGCVVPQVICGREKQATPENRKKAAGLVRKELKREIKDRMPSFLGKITSPDPHIDLTNYKITMPYSCDPITITEKDSCKSLIKNGDSSKKADVLFIGEGYESLEEFESFLNDVLSYDIDPSRVLTIPNDKLTEEQIPSDILDYGYGLFAEEPFKSNKEKFNIWFMLSDSPLVYEISKTSPGDGASPIYKDILQIANKCPWFDYVLLLTKDHDFRANCQLGKPSICRIPSNDNYISRLITHEFGHGFGALEDEYYNFIEKKENNNNPAKYFDEFELGPNCVNSKEKAEASWGNLVDDKIGFFKACGGDCGATCANYIKPTYNSIMRAQIENCEGINEDIPCQLGPPFTSFYGVNERAILKELEQYS